MRINKFVAAATGLSRRAADRAIVEGRVTIAAQAAHLGDTVAEGEVVTLDKQPITPPVKTQAVMLNKPVGYVCSRAGQGSRTIYDLLPPEFHHLKPVGRLDKYSSGLLLLTNNGELANYLTHPRYAKTKIYELKLDKPLTPTDQKIITGHGVSLEDGLSKLQLDPLEDELSKTPLTASDQQNRTWRVTMQEGRNRQIRRTFAALGYQVTRLHRTHLGDYKLGKLPEGQIRQDISYVT